MLKHMAHKIERLLAYFYKKMLLLIMRTYVYVKYFVIMQSNKCHE